MGNNIYKVSGCSGSRRPWLRFYNQGTRPSSSDLCVLPPFHHFSGCSQSHFKRADLFQDALPLRRDLFASRSCLLLSSSERRSFLILYLVPPWVWTHAAFFLHATCSLLRPAASCFRWTFLCVPIHTCLRPRLPDVKGKLSKERARRELAAMMSCILRKNIAD